MSLISRPRVIKKKKEENATWSMKRGVTVVPSRCTPSPSIQNTGMFFNTPAHHHPDQPLYPTNHLAASGHFGKTSISTIPARTLFMTVDSNGDFPGISRGEISGGKDISGCLWRYGVSLTPTNDEM